MADDADLRVLLHNRAPGARLRAVNVHPGSAVSRETPPARRPARGTTLVLAVGAICFALGVILGAALGLALALSFIAGAP